MAVVSACSFAQKQFHKSVWILHHCVKGKKFITLIRKACVSAQSGKTYWEELSIVFSHLRSLLFFLYNEEREVSSSHPQPSSN